MTLSRCGSNSIFEGFLKRTTALTAIGAVTGAVAGWAPVALAQDESADDEIIVTGSYIRRGNFDSVSPIDVVDQADLLLQARPQMGEIIRNQTFNYGVTTVDNIEGTSFQFGTFSQANLRGLGAGSTLTLMDGRRSVTENVNLMYPQIAVQRVETLLDGAAALYGTDAVAGVVNFIPFKDFEGMKVSLDYRADDKFDTEELNFSTMFGAGNDRTNVVGAIEINDRTRMKRSDRPKYSEASAGELLVPIPNNPGILVGGNNVPNGAPGSFQVPLRNPATGGYLPEGFGLAGAGLNYRVARDPGCGNPNFSIQDYGEINRQSGIPSSAGGPDGSGFIPEQCNSSFADLTDFIADQERIQGYMGVRHQISDNWRFEGEVVFNRMDSKSRGFLSVVGGRFDQLASIPGDLPGNPFVASVSLPNLDPQSPGFLNPILLQIYAQDADQDGIPDRQTDSASPLYDVNGDGLADVILAANPYAPDTLDPIDGGIAFMEDVRINDATFGGKLFTPTPQFSKNFGDDGTGPFAGTFEQQTWRLGGTVIYEIPNSNWLWQSSGFYHRSTGLFNSTDNSFNNVNLGLQGNLNTGTFEDNVEIQDYFNPFSTAQFDPGRTNFNDATSEDTDSGDAAQNSQAIVDRIFTDRVAIAKDRLITIDSFVSGDLFDLPGGTIGSALGVHYRHERAEDNQPSIETLDDQFVDRQELDSYNQRDVWAIFGELAVPLFDDESFGSMELSLAGRYEDYGDGLNTFDPKIGVLWKLFDDELSLRGSWGTSFVAPTLDQLFGPPGSFLRNTTDPLTNIGPIFVTTENNSNANLVPEEAETWNFGASWEVVENLTISADYYSFDFTDRIVLLAGQDNLEINFANFLEAGNTEGNQTDIDNWIANNEEGLIRRAQDNTPTFISGGFINATTIKTKGMDFGINYLVDGEDMGLGDIGTFNFQAKASWIHSYDFQLSELFDIEDVAGQRNDPTQAAPPLPEWRINGSATWNRGSHSVYMGVRFIDSVKDDSIFADLGMNMDALGENQVIPTHTEVDLSYTYSWEEGVFGDDRMTVFTVGSINILDNDPPAFNTLGGMETFLHDPRGRMIYARVAQDL